MIIDKIDCFVFKYSIKIYLKDFYQLKAIEFTFDFNFILIFLFDISKAETNNSVAKNNDRIKIEYLDSKKTLEDYIIDSGDKLYIEFENNSKGNPDLIKKEKFRDNLTTEYLDPNTNLENYFLDEDDQIFINFIKTPELNKIVTVDRQGEVFLPRIKETYVRGLSIYEL